MNKTTYLKLIINIIELLKRGIVSPIVKGYIFLFVMIGMTSCMNFRMDLDELQEAFENEKLSPISDTIKIGERYIHYIHTPKSKNSVLIFVHGSPGSWSAFIDYFKSEKLLSEFDIISVDRPGYGASDYGMPETSIKTQVSLIKEAIAGKYKKQIWIGHSLGGPVVARMAMDYPEEVDGLVLLAPSIDPEMEKYEWYRTWFKTKIIGAVMPTAFWVSNEEILPLKAELELMIPYWKGISAKTIIIHGTDDQLVPVQNAYFAKKMMIDSLVTQVIIDGAGHFIPWSHKDLIIDQILTLK